jgi:transposase-like protein
MLTVVNADGTPSNGSLIDEIVREGARRMLAAALEAEVNSYLAYLADARDTDGRRLVVRNGFHAEQTIATSAGPVQVRAPRVNDKRVDAETGERKRFSSTILPPWARKTPKISEVLPLLYLHGLSTGDFVPALEQFLGSAAGLSSATVSRLTSQWTDDHKAFQKRDLSATDFVYVWADGVHLKVRLDQAKACVLVLVGVRADGSKELIALDEGYRESWANLVRDCARRGMRAPHLAVGDGALGFWKALREVFPETKEQRSGCTKLRMSWIPCRSRRSRRPRPRSQTSTTPRTKTRPPRPSGYSSGSTVRSSPRPSRRLSTTRTYCWGSTTTQPNTGSTCAPRTRLSQHSPPSGCAPGSPAMPAPARQPWR